MPLCGVCQSEAEISGGNTVDPESVEIDRPCSRCGGR